MAAIMGPAKSALTATSAAAAVASKSGHFYLFKSPTVIMPSLDLWRRAWNPINRIVYGWSEKHYSYEAFMDGAVQALLLASLELRERRLDKFREISTEQLTRYMSRRLPELPRDQLAEQLNFGREQIVHGFTHASFWTLVNISKKIQVENECTSFHTTFVFFIDKTEGQQWARPSAVVKAEQARGEVDFAGAPRIAKMLRTPQDWLICNMTLSRQMSMQFQGRWRITDINFFDCQFAMDKMHDY